MTGEVTKENPKSREQRLRRMAERQRFVLQKSRRRDERAWNFGLYQIIDLDTNAVVLGGSYSTAPYFTLDQVEEWLTSDPLKRTV